MLNGLLDRYRSLLAIMLFMIGGGLLTYITIAREADPDIDVPIFYISQIYQGISPEDSERLLVQPMETHLRGIDGLKELTAFAFLGGAAILAEFNTTVDLQKASQALREKLDLAKADLPSEAEEPVLNEINMSLFPVIAVVLSGDLPERQLFERAKNLRREIEAIPSVLEATLNGAREELLEVEIDSQKLDSYGVTPTQLINIVSRSNQTIPAGSIDHGKGRFNVKVSGLFKTPSDVTSIPIKVNGDSVITLGQVATIKSTFKTATNFSHYRGKPALVISVKKRKGANIIENNLAVRKLTKDTSKKWPHKLQVDFAFDRSFFINEVLGSLENTIITAILLVMFVIFATLGVRSSLLVGFSIPASFLIGFLFIGIAGMTINMMLMFGLVLTVGILVDSAIVLTEYANRKIAEGLDNITAYKLAANRMFWPVVSSTATTLAAFMPLLFWPGVSGKFMSYLPITVIFVLSSSLITALIFVPVLGRFMGHTKNSADEIKRAQLLSKAKSLDVTQVAGWLGRYMRFLNYLCDRPLVLSLATIYLLAGIGFGFSKFNKGVEFFVDTDPEQGIVFVKARGNHSAIEQLKLVRQAEEIIASTKGISTILTQTGGSSASPEYGTGVADAPVDQIGQITIEFTPFHTRQSGKIILNQLREKLQGLSGVETEVRKREDGPPVGKAIRLEIASSTLAHAQEAAKKIRRHLVTQMDGLRDFEDSLPLPGVEWSLSVDRKEAGRFGADITMVGGMIQLVTDGILIGKYRPAGSEDEVDIRARLPQTERNLTGLDRLRVTTDNGVVPLNNFLTRKAVPRVNQIIRKNGKFVVDVKAQTIDGVLANDKINELNEWLTKQVWQPGVSYRFRGADEEQKESGAFLMKAMLASLFIMFVILVTQFNSFYQAILTLATVVLSIFGVLLGMLITGQTFSIIMTGTGIVALAGIIVNNAIVLIDTVNIFQKDGLSARDAAIRAAAQRLRPILLTTITTICGLLPLALQLSINPFDLSFEFGSMTAIWWVQMATAIIWGLGFATLLTLILVPVYLAVPSEFYARQKALWARYPHSS